ncbi:MAG: ABC transporter ATP-binding protein [Lachnospiraceae bacterium]|nr:ABC transporter ATP-binding protein [Lachnospiraceae bacterium]
MIKTLLSQVKQYKLVSVLTPICMILEVILESFIPLVIGWLITNGIEAKDQSKIIYYGVIMIILAVLSLIVGALGGIFGSKASTGFAKNLRKAMFENIQTFSFSNIDKFSTASLITRLTTDVTNLQMAYQMMLRMFTRAPFSLIVAMTMAFFVNKKIATIYLIAVLVLGTILVLIMSRAVKYFNAVFKKYDDLNESVQENIIGMRVVKSFVREDYEKERFKKASGNIYMMFKKAENIITYNGPVMMLTVYSCMILISWLGANYIVGGELAIGDLTTLLGYCMNILMSLMMLSMIFVMVTMSYASAKRITEVLNEKSDLTNGKCPIFEVIDGSIEFKDVSFSYKEDSDESVLKNINLSINAGETIGIIGGTGSAKTSLVNLISRLYDVSDGELFVGGVNVKEYDLETLRKKVAVVLQKNVLFSGTVLENLRWGNKEATKEECIEACKLACADGFIEKMKDGYDTFIEQGGSNVSGGQKQRLCIARALLTQPKVLILDDSTSAVDTATDARIREAFLKKIPDTTKIIIAQRISSIQHADRIIVMEDGEINGIGTHDYLVEHNDIYKDVYESQIGNTDLDVEGGAE